MHVIWQIWEQTWRAPKKPCHPLRNIRANSSWELRAVYLLYVSVPTILDLGDNSCGHSHKNHPCFSESSRQNHSGKSPLNQQCMNLLQTDTGGLPVRKKYVWLACCTANMIDIDSGDFFLNSQQSLFCFFGFCCSAVSKLRKEGENPTCAQ